MQAHFQSNKNRTRPKLKPSVPLFLNFEQANRAFCAYNGSHMKKLLLSLLSIGALIGSANAMAPLGPSMINHYRQGDQRTIVVPANDTIYNNVFLGPLHKKGSFVFLGPLHKKGSFVFLGPLHKKGSFVFLGPLHRGGSFAFIGPLHPAKA
jgi:hypothetical protein